MSHRENLCQRQEKGWSNHSLSCPLPWGPRVHKSSAGIAAYWTTMQMIRSGQWDAAAVIEGMAPTTLRTLPPPADGGLVSDRGQHVASQARTATPLGAHQAPE